MKIISNFIYKFKENCEIRFSDEILSKILDAKLYTKYERFKQLKIINSDPSLKWCNRSGCTLYCKINPDSQKIVCLCGHEMCFSCGNNWHEGKIFINLFLIF